MADEIEEILGGEGKSLGVSGLNETLGRVFGLPGNDDIQATQGGDSAPKFDPTAYILDSLGNMQAAPDNSGQNDPSPPTDSSQTQDSESE